MDVFHSIDTCWTEHICSVDVVVSAHELFTVGLDTHCVCSPVVTSWFLLKWCPLLPHVRDQITGRVSNRSSAEKLLILIPIPTTCFLCVLNTTAFLGSEKSPADSEKRNCGLPKNCPAHKSLYCKKKSWDFFASFVFVQNVSMDKHNGIFNLLI